MKAWRNHWLLELKFATVREQGDSRHRGRHRFWLREGSISQGVETSGRSSLAPQV